MNCMQANKDKYVQPCTCDTFWYSTGTPGFSWSSGGMREWKPTWPPRSIDEHQVIKMITEVQDYVPYLIGYKRQLDKKGNTMLTMSLKYNRDMSSVL